MLGDSYPSFSSLLVLHCSSRTCQALQPPPSPLHPPQSIPGRNGFAARKVLGRRLPTPVLFCSSREACDAMRASLTCRQSKMAGSGQPIRSHPSEPSKTCRPSNFPGRRDSLIFLGSDWLAAIAWGVAFCGGLARGGGGGAVGISNPATPTRTSFLRSATLLTPSCMLGSKRGGEGLDELSSQEAPVWLLSFFLCCFTYIHLPTTVWTLGETGMGQLQVLRCVCGQSYFSLVVLLPAGWFVSVTVSLVLGAVLSRIFVVLTIPTTLLAC
ncbi:hypothetical protein QBC47DRAFT_373196 [Echria macrotheca]|uniref:Uncharacterized protein n=1 Tax=Echria macrotheca TaxID=438768 RepID=A0AAJ0BMD0_9PEZI|nr:hypothetical protein QBC47DRAFT_373196 [Echria macrotheca]